MRRILGLTLLASAVVIVAVVVGWPVYVHPQVEPLRRADAVLILGGDFSDRYQYGLGLANDGWAPTVAVSSPGGTWLTDQCATPHLPYALYCFVPHPSTTKGEGQELRRLAAEHHWRTVIVVTFRPHISRARYILQQCFEGELIMVSSPANISLARWVFEYMYQTAGYVQALLHPGC